jgi:peptidoglycan hydrolase-like protein with peptidoglycan-binding domain
LARSKKTAVRGIVEPRLRPSTISIAVLSATLGSMILYNLFLGQEQYSVEELAAGTTRMTVSAPGKQSRSILLKYEVLVEDVQRELLATGHFQGLVDGVNGPRTKLAVEAYERDNSMVVTGEVSKKLLEHIRYTRKLTQAAEFTGTVTPAQEEAPAQ